MTNLRQQLGEALFTRVAGPDGARHRERIHGTPGPRWFDPASPIGRVHGDAAMFVGGIRAVLLQTLHPAAMTAVAEHSGYRGDMWGRLARTSRFLAVTTFGTAEPRPAGGRRRARDPHARDAARSTTGRRTPPPTRTCCCGCTSRRSTASCGPTRPTVGCRSTRPAATSTSPRPREVAQRLGVIDPPTTEAELADVLEAFRPELRVTPHAREAVRHLLWHPDLPYAARPAYGVLVAAAIGSMPGWARRELRLPWAPLTGPAVTRAMGRAATSTIRWAMTPQRLSSTSGPGA